jgi:hypothetical protein
VACLMAETDGTLIPLVETDDAGSTGQPGDRRKTRHGRWHEARCARTHPHEAGGPVLGCTPGGPRDAGDQRRNGAIRSGLGQATPVPCVGDGAPWRANQGDRGLGPQGGVLIACYHLREDLAAAARQGAPEDPDARFRHAKQPMQDNQEAAVVEEVRAHLEPDSIPDTQAPVRGCFRSIANRPGQFDDQGA